MLSYGTKLISIEVVLLLLLLAPARSEDFEIIAPDVVRIETAALGGIASSGGLMWLVATTEVISLAQLQSASISVSIDNPDLSVSASILNEGLAAPVLPGEVVGHTTANSAGSPAPACPIS